MNMESATMPIIKVYPKFHGNTLLWSFCNLERKAAGFVIPSFKKRNLVSVYFQTEHFEYTFYKQTAY